MVAIYDDEGPVRLVGCAPLYKVPQTKWTPRLTVQLTVYVVLIGMSMAAGGLLPYWLEVFYGWKIGDNHSLNKMFSQDQGYDYTNNNTYAFCPKNARVYSYDTLPRGYPAPPLAPKGGKLYDAWYHKPVTLKGVSWFGFNNAQGGPDGLWAGGSQATTDFAAIVYELKLLGFNTIRLPFTFDTLQRHGANLVHKCTSSSTADLAKHTTDPQASPQPDFSVVPVAPVHLDVEDYHGGLCNTYMPPNADHVIQRLLWTLQFLIGNGFYVVLDYHPSAGDALGTEARDFARAWLYTWATITCLPNFASDIRGRVILDLLNEPDSLGLAWTEQGGLPGLDELYLTVMDSIENVTQADALYMLQGAVLSTKAATEAGQSSVRLNKYGLSAGDGFVVDQSIIERYQLSDPKPFLNDLLQRPYRSRVLLGPHLYGPDNSGVEPATADDMVARWRSSWGQLATEGYCYRSDCMKFPVIAGEVGSQLDSPREMAYYNAVAEYAHLGASASEHDAPLVGWIWWAFNANSEGTGGLVTDNWQNFAWPKLRYLIQNFGLQPWYADVKSYLSSVSTQQADAVAARAAADAAAAAEAAKAAAAAAAGPALNLTSVTAAVAPIKPVHKNAADADKAKASSSSGAVGGSAMGTSATAAGAGTVLNAARTVISPSNIAGAVQGIQGRDAGTTPLPAAASSQQQANSGYATFDNQPPPSFGAMQATTADSNDPNVALYMKVTDVAAEKPSELVDSHANLPVDDWESSSYFEVPATIAEEANEWDVPATVEELPM